MAFNSYGFLFAFLPVAILGYFMCNKRNKKLGMWWMILASFVFYCTYSVPASGVLLSSIALNWSAYVFIRRNQARGNEKVTLIMRLVVIVNLLMLFVFKYAITSLNFINSLVGTNFILDSIVVPVGISFLTFSQISFVIDCVKEDKTQYTLVEYIAFISYFPKILSGPIMTINRFVSQIEDEANQRFNWENFSKGLFGFSIGLAKKVLIANWFAKIVSYAFGNPTSCSGIEAILAIFAFSIELYFDFSGYCDMAVGAAKMMNIDLPQNFNSPYRATDFQDFWKRWHMTLTAFLTKYLYYPLGGNRKGRLRQYINIIIVFLLSGIWHGAGITYIIWGAIHAVFNILSRYVKVKKTGLMRAFSVVATFLFVTIAWVFFRAASVNDALLLFKTAIMGPIGECTQAMKDSIVPPTLFNIFTQILSFRGAIITVFAAVMGMVFFGKNSTELMKDFKPNFIYSVATTILFVLSIISLTGVQTFIYTGF